MGYKEPKKDTLARIGGDIYDQFKAFRVLNGQLAACRRSRGISSTKNPSERRCGSIRFKEILEDLPGVLAMLRRMEGYFAKNRSVSVAAMLDVLGAEKCMYTQAPTYKNVRCCRILAEAAGKPFKNCIEDFSVFQRMSKHMRGTLEARGINEFKVAMRFVKGMKQVTGEDTYSLNDLVIYTCLLDDLVFDD